MGQDGTKTQRDGTALFAGEAWLDPAANASRFGEIETGIRERVRRFIQELLEQEMTAALGRTRHERSEGKPAGYRNGTRERQLLGSFGAVALSVPRARRAVEGGGTQEWHSATLPRYARMTKQVEALIAGAYLSGTNTRRVKRALAALLGGAVGKDVAQIALRFRWVSRTWRKVCTDWDAWNGRDLGVSRSESAWAGEDAVRLVLDGTVVRVRLDRKATNVSLLVVLGVRRDGQKVLLAAKNMGGESEAAWRGILDGLIARGLSRKPEGFRRHARVPDHRRWGRAGAGTGGAVARRAGPALHGSQAQEAAGPRARGAARGGRGNPPGLPLRPTTRT